MPPSSGARKLPVDRIAAHSAIIRARCAGVRSPATSMARVVGNRAAQPMPARIWPIHICVHAVRRRRRSPRRSRASAAPPMSRRLRPNRSPSTPQVSSSTVIGSSEQSDIQVSWEPVGLKTSWNVPLRVAGMARPICARQTANRAAAIVPARSVPRLSPEAWGSVVFDIASFVLMAPRWVTASSCAVSGPANGRACLASSRLCRPARDRKGARTAAQELRQHIVDDFGDAS